MIVTEFERKKTKTNKRSYGLKSAKVFHWVFKPPLAPGGSCGFASDPNCENEMKDFKLSFEILNCHLKTY